MQHHKLVHNLKSGEIVLSNPLTLVSGPQGCGKSTFVNCVWSHPLDQLLPRMVGRAPVIMVQGLAPQAVVVAHSGWEVDLGLMCTTPQSDHGRRPDGAPALSAAMDNLGCVLHRWRIAVEYYDRFAFVLEHLHALTGIEGIDIGFAELEPEEGKAPGSLTIPLPIHKRVIAMEVPKRRDLVMEATTCHDRRLASCLAGKSVYALMAMLTTIASADAGDVIVIDGIDLFLTRITLRKLLGILRRAALSRDVTMVATLQDPSSIPIDVMLEDGWIAGSTVLETPRLLAEPAR